MSPFVFDFILAGGIFLATTLFYLLLLSLEKHRLKLFFKKKIEKSNIITGLVDVAVRVKELEEDIDKYGLCEYPNTLFYISQANQLIKQRGFNIDGVVVTSLFELSDDIPGFSKEGFLREISKLDEKTKSKERKKKKVLLDLIRQTSGLFGRIYRLQHPLQYRIKEIKKRALLKIMDILIKFIALLEKSEDKRRIKISRPKNETFSLKSIIERKEKLNEASLAAMM